jgi:hypothetical protein
MSQAVDGASTQPRVLPLEPRGGRHHGPQPVYTPQPLQGAPHGAATVRQGRQQLLCQGGSGLLGVTHTAWSSLSMIRQ